MRKVSPADRRKGLTVTIRTHPRTDAAVRKATRRTLINKARHRPRRALRENRHTPLQNLAGLFHSVGQWNNVSLENAKKTVQFCMIEVAWRRLQPPTRRIRSAIKYYLRWAEIITTEMARRGLEIDVPEEPVREPIRMLDNQDIVHGYFSRCGAPLTGRPVHDDRPITCLACLSQESP